MKEIKRSLFIILLLLVLSYTVQADFVHRVTPGENLFKIAEKYSLTIDDIIQTNNMLNPENIKTNQIIIIPNVERSGIYRVQEGDSLYKISQKLSIPVSILAKENKIINGNQLYLNQPLSIPLRYRYPQQYTVKPADTIYKIADKFELSSNEIIIINKLTDTNIYPEQSLKIPVSISPYNTQYNIKYPNTLYYEGITQGNKIALTFDDGPDPYYTEQVLEILKKHNVLATFFIVGNNVESYPDVTRGIVEDGHIIANHSWSHANLRQLNKTDLLYQIKATENIIEDYTGVEMRFLRPPWGYVSDTLLQVAQAMDYKIINWNVDSEDWNGKSVDQILLNTIPYTKDNSIILFHSAGGRDQSLNATINVLPELIETLKANGYTFVTLDELLNTNPYKS